MSSSRDGSRRRTKNRIVYRTCGDDFLPGTKPSGINGPLETKLQTSECADLADLCSYTTPMELLLSYKGSDNGRKKETQKGRYHTLISTFDFNLEFSFYFLSLLFHLISTISLLFFLLHVTASNLAFFSSLVKL